MRKYRKISAGKGARDAKIKSVVRANQHQMTRLLDIADVSRLDEYAILLTRRPRLLTEKLIRGSSVDCSGDTARCRLLCVARRMPLIDPRAIRARARSSSP